MISSESHSETARILEALEIGDELFLEPSRQAIPGAWTGHLAIAFWLIKAARPSTFVELGTHSGNSYSAFCQAIAHLGLQARAFAVDTWRGDEHSGLYGEEVFKELNAFNESHFAGFSKLLRATFDEARSYFPESSIDLLHIDGLHTYDAVKRDFDNWKSALSASAVVVIHDTNVRERDFGVWRLWRELAQIYPTFEFHHSEGLGVLGFGQRQTRLMKRLFELAEDSQSTAMVRRIFASRGETFRSRSQVLDLADRLAFVSNNLRQQSHRISALEHEIVVRDASLRDRDQQIQSNAEAISNLERGLVSRDATLADREQELRTRDEEIQRASSSIKQLQLTIASKDKVFGESAIKSRAQLDEERSTASHRIELLQQELARAQQKLGLIESSSAWKIVSPLRSVFQPYPTVRLYARRLARLIWWTVTFQLIDRLRARRRLFMARDLIANSQLFDGAWYLSQYPDLVEAGCDPALHYALYGATERRNPGPGFDAEAYLQRYPDVAEAGANPLLHYLEHGASAGRIITPKDAPPDATEAPAEPPKHDYPSWVSSYDALHDEDRAAIRSHIERLGDRPLISIVMPVYNTNPIFLRKAIDSVLAQLYPNWELCIADDASSSPQIRTILEESALRDERIKAVYRDQNGHIAAASNSALEVAKGAFVALMDHDDELSEHALYLVAVTLNEHPESDIIYSDEDKIDCDGVRQTPYFKPDWNPELFYSQNYFNHLGVYRASLVRSAGGFRVGYEGSQDYDLALRIIALTRADRIRHIPHVLYHWRATPGVQTFSSDSLPTAVQASRRALADYFAQHGHSVRVTGGKLPQYNRLIRQLPDPAPRVSLIIPTRDHPSLLRGCVDGLLHRTAYDNVEIIIVDNDSCEIETIEYLTSLQQESKVRVLRIEGEFNYSSLNNRAVCEAKGDVIGFINNDIEVIHPEWLQEMVSHVAQPGVGAVGAKLFYPDDTIQHAGVIVGVGGVAGHSHRFFPRSAVGYFGRLQLVHDLSCVTAACMLMPKKVFEEVGGFDEVNLTVAFNDVDLCLRIREAGYRIVWTPYAELYHLESASRGSDVGVLRAATETEYMKSRWGDALLNDPFYSPNLTLDDEDYSLAFPPRVPKPWQSAVLEENLLNQA